MRSFARDLSRICREAGRLVLDALRNREGPEAKEGHEVVTSADYGSESLLRVRLESLLPGVPVVGEEGNDPVGEPPYWLVDPLDGTTNFVHGYPVFSISVALVGHEGPEAACVHDPSRKETFLAWKGGGAFLNGRHISCSHTSVLEQALLATGFPYSRTPENLGFEISPLLYFLGRARGIRRSGSAALDLSYVACGRLDGYWEEHLRPWDMAAGVLLVIEAGGIAGAYSGGPWNSRAGGVLAGAPELFPALTAGIARLTGEHIHGGTDRVT
jgi:myo-inositol-1(or 4)-monophosphatase